MMQCSEEGTSFSNMHIASTTSSFSSRSLSSEPGSSINGGYGVHRGGAGLQEFIKSRLLLAIQPLEDVIENVLPGRTRNREPVFRSEGGPVGVNLQT